MIDITMSGLLESYVQEGVAFAEAVPGPHPKGRPPHRRTQLGDSPVVAVVVALRPRSPAFGHIR